MQYLISVPFKHNFLHSVKDYAERGIFFTLEGKQVVAVKKESFNNISFEDLEGKFLWNKDEEKIIQHIPITLEKIDGIDFKYVEQKEVLTKKYKDFENGEYLVILFDIRAMKLENEIFTRHQNLTVMGPCFGFDVEDNKKILAYVKLRNL